MARALGISPAYVNLLENNQRSVPGAVMLRLFDAYAVDWRDIAENDRACPRLEVHTSFRTPGRIVPQLVEMPDASQYFVFARTVDRPTFEWHAQDNRLAVVMGCRVFFQLSCKRGFHTPRTHCCKRGFHTPAPTVASGGFTLPHPRGIFKPK